MEDFSSLFSSLVSSGSNFAAAEPASSLASFSSAFAASSADWAAFGAAGTEGAGIGISLTGGEGLAASAFFSSSVFSFSSVPGSGDPRDGRPLSAAWPSWLPYFLI